MERKKMRDFFNRIKSQGEILNKPRIYFNLICMAKTSELLITPVYFFPSRNHKSQFLSSQYYMRRIDISHIQEWPIKTSLM